MPLRSKRVREVAWPNVSMPTAPENTDLGRYIRNTGAALSTNYKGLGYNLMKTECFLT